MTDKKLTDEQIEIALEHCKISNCLGCPCHSCVESCLDVLTPNVLNLIKRLKSQNKEFDEKIVIQLGTIDWQAKEINHQKAEIERLKKENERFADIGKMYSEIKSETIKEYKEKVKAILMDKGIYPVVVKNALNEAEKEMNGGE